jgi:outer membrane protein OmpA-like peptidoglycan-associated protein
VVTDSPAPTAPVSEETKPITTVAVPPERKSPAEPRVNDEDNNVFFDRGSTSVNTAEKEKLREHANRLKQNPKKYVTLTGYADDLGSRNYKLAIAEERLVAVNKVLQSYGVSPRQIRRNRSASVKNSPACKKADCLRLKRRVELVYSK